MGAKLSKLASNPNITPLNSDFIFRMGIRMFTLSKSVKIR